MFSGFASECRSCPGDFVQFLVKQRRRRRFTPALGEMDGAENAHRAGKRDREHVALPDHVSRVGDAPPVDTDIARGGKGSRERPGFHNARMP